jgi:ABC-type sulfate/molybdate transport systems ATPase subunit
VTAPVLEILGVSKDFHGLRPLRIEHLMVAAGEHVAILGMDAACGEVLVNLITGATLPDAGRIAAFGRSTADISDSADWLASVDRFGIVSERAVLLEGLDVLQNLAVPFTLDIEPPSQEMRERAIELAAEVNLGVETWDRKVATLDAAARVRLRLARALALQPGVLLVEHASAGLTAGQAAALGPDMRAVATRRGAAIVAITADEAFARGVAGRVLQWEPASGRLRARSDRWSSAWRR